MNVDKILLQIRAKRQSLNYSQEYVAHFHIYPKLESLAEVSRLFV